MADEAKKSSVLTTLAIGAGLVGVGAVLFYAVGRLIQEERVDRLKTEGAQAVRRVGLTGVVGLMPFGGDSIALTGLGLERLRRVAEPALARLEAP